MDDILDLSLRFERLYSFISSLDLSFIRQKLCQGVYLMCLQRNLKRKLRMFTREYENKPVKIVSGIIQNFLLRKKLRSLIVIAVTTI